MSRWVLCARLDKPILERRKARRRARKKREGPGRREEKGQGEQGRRERMKNKMEVEPLYTFISTTPHVFVERASR